MKIYTSYFGNSSRLHAAGVEPIGISRWQPRWFRGKNMKNLAPTSYMLSDNCTHEEYIRLYNDILNNLDLDKLRSDLEVIGHDVALCCYEKPGDFCHRHILADYLNQHGWDIQEFGFQLQSKKQEPKAEQMALF